MKEKEAIKLLQAAMGNEGDMVHCFEVNMYSGEIPQSNEAKRIELIRLALVLLREPEAKCMHCGKVVPKPIYGDKVCCIECLYKQPEAGEFTKRAKAALPEETNYDAWTTIDRLLEEACTRLNRQAGDIAQLEVLLSDAREENKELKKALQDKHRKHSQEYYRLVAAEKRLKKYAWHLKDCAVRAGLEPRVRPDKNCDCGLVEILSKLERK